MSNLDIMNLNSTAFLRGFCNVTGLSISEVSVEITSYSDPSSMNTFQSAEVSMKHSIRYVVTASVAKKFSVAKYGNISSTVQSVFGTDAYKDLISSIYSDMNLNATTIKVASYGTGLVSGPQYNDVTAVPSTAPTTMPTATPTISPTVIVPVIQSMSTLGRTDSIQVYAALNSRIDNPGRVFCSALKIAPTDSGSLRQSPFYVDYATIANPVMVNITGLVPLTSYTVYCMVYTLFGYGNTLDELGRSTVSTKCCYRIEFTKAPLQVYGDIRKYSQSVENIFSFAVRSTPRTLIRVTPIVTLPNGSIVDNSVLGVYPKGGFTFSSNSGGKLTGQFYLQGLSTLSGSYNVVLNVSGVSSGDYFAVPAQSVQILSSSEPQPAPVVQSAIFSDSGTSVTVLFNTGTDFGGGSGQQSFTCDILFIFNRIAGSATWATCRWLNSSSLSIQSLDINPGDEIWLLDGAYRVACSSATAVCKKNLQNAFQIITVLAPVNPIQPAVSLSSAKVVTNCVDFTLDASNSVGNGGRPWQSIYWTVSASTNDDDYSGQMAEVLNNYGSISKILVVPKSMLSPGTFTFTLYLTNFLGASAVGQQIVQVTDDNYLPLVLIKSTRLLQVYAKDALTVTGGASLSACALGNPTLSYSWSITPAPIYADNSPSPRVFSLPSYSLAVGVTYTLSFSATTSSVSSKPTGQDTIQIFVISGPVIATISGESIGGATFIAHLNCCFYVCRRSLSHSAGFQGTATCWQHFS